MDHTCTCSYHCLTVEEYRHVVTCISILQETEDPASDDDSGHTDSEGGVDSMDIVSRESTCT